MFVPVCKCMRKLQVKHLLHTLDVCTYMHTCMHAYMYQCEYHLHARNVRVKLVMYTVCMYDTLALYANLFPVAIELHWLLKVISLCEYYY